MKKNLIALITMILFNSIVIAKEKDNIMMESILKNVIYPDIDRAQLAIVNLQDAIKKDNKNERTVNINISFSNFLKAWKRVQAAYILGEVDVDMIDTPRLIDNFHQGNEKLDVQIARAIASNDKPKIALFKNTFKSINALEIILFKDDILSEVEKEYANYILSSINNYLSDIKKTYKKKSNILNQKLDESMSYILNALIDSSFKLKEWRIGEASGIAKKYKNKPNNKYQEYFLSSNSLSAADAIINLHDDIMGDKKYFNLGSIAIEQGAKKQVQEIRGLINKAKEQLENLIKLNITDFKSPLIKPLYKTLSMLNDKYYQSLVRALPVQAKILDADGD